MLIFTSFSNVIFTFVAAMIAGHEFAIAYPHPRYGYDRTDFPHRNTSIADSPPLRRDSCTGNWAGAVWENSPSGVAWTGPVTAYFVAPRAVSMQVSAFIWVGIDGTVCNKPSFQVGVQAYLVNDGSTQYYAVAQWGLEQSYQFDNVPIDSGDILVITATAPTAASGTATIQNISKNVQASHTFNYPEQFLFTSAEWIVQTFDQDGTGTAFGEVGFYNAQATQYDGTAVNGAGADMYDAGGAATVSADVYGGIAVSF